MNIKWQIVEKKAKTIYVSIFFHTLLPFGNFFQLTVWVRKFKYGREVQFIK